MEMQDGDPMDQMTDETELTVDDLAEMWAAAEPVEVERRPGRSLRRAPSARFEVYRDADGRFRWHLRAANGRVIATSETAYATKASAVSSIATVRRDVPAAVTSDLT